MKKFKGSTIIPLCMLVYLAVMAWVGRGSLSSEATIYWIKLGVGLVIIVGLYFALRRKEQLRRRREEQEATYGHYDDSTPDSSNTKS